jgi:hypothetical protein
MTSSRRYFMALVAVLLALGLAAGCSDEEDDCPVCPGAPSPTMDNLWPNDDGNSWTYDRTVRRWETVPWTLYEDPGDVPPIPSVEYVEARLGVESVGAGADTISEIFRLEFDGTCVGDSGAAGQCLVETLFDEWMDDIMMVPYEQILYHRLLASRPDLGLAIRSMDCMSTVPAGPEAVQLIRSALILHGGVWEKTSDYVGTYGDLDTLLAWKYLESDISTGHEFTFQLVPSIASDVLLHCKVLSRGSCEMKYGTYKNAVECLYIIDHGLASTETIEGTRYYRVYDYGTITYAPGVGPVQSYERMMIDTTVPDGPGYGDMLLELIGTGSE